MQHLQLEPWTELSLRPDETFISAELDWAGRVVVLTSTQPTDFRYTADDGASYFRSKPEAPRTYRVHHLSDEWSRVTEIKDVPLNMTSAQPLPDNHLLLVCPRSSGNAEDDSYTNALISTENGVLVSGFHAGDAIGHVQTSPSGEIWVGYFDEAYGTGDYSGIIQLSADGRMTYSYAPPPGCGDVLDCYSLNVCSDSEVWSCYYTDFPIVRIEDGSAVSFGESPVDGIKALSVSGDDLLLSGGYDESQSRGVWISVREGKTETKAVIQYLSREGNPLYPSGARGSRTLFVEGESIYRLEMRDLARLLK